MPQLPTRIPEAPNSESADPDPTDPLLGSQTVNPVTVGTHGFVVGANLATADGALELLRYRFRLEVPSTTADGWIHFRMLNPTWLTN